LIKPPDQRSRPLGLLYILLSAAGFGAMPIFAKIAYAEGIDLPTLLFLRFALAGGLMAAIMFIRGLYWPRGHSLWLLIAMGGIGYVGQAFCYFAALQHATAGLTALLLYLYPVIVTLISAWSMRQRLSPLRIAAVCAALFGTGLAVGDSLDGSALGIALGLGAAVIYSIYILIGEKATAAAGAIPSATVVMLSAAAVYGGALIWRGILLPASIEGWAAVGSIALFSTVLAIVAFFAAMQSLGAADAASLSTLEPVITVLLAAIFLGEAIGVWQLVGGTIILLAVVVLARSRLPAPSPGN
jgi:drug/metabolite transporter (DMT)-like permease